MITCGKIKEVMMAFCSTTRSPLRCTKLGMETSERTGFEIMTRFAPMVVRTGADSEVKELLFEM